MIPSQVCHHSDQVKSSISDCRRPSGPGDQRVVKGRRRGLKAITITKRVTHHQLIKGAQRNPRAWGRASKSCPHRHHIDKTLAMLAGLQFITSPAHLPPMCTTHRVTPSRICAFTCSHAGQRTSRIGRSLLRRRLPQLSGHDILVCSSLVVMLV